MSNTRIEGYYYVKINGTWEIAKWCIKKSYPKGTTYWLYNGRMYKDADFAEIDERKLERPE